MLRCKVFFRSFTTILLYSTVKTNSSQVPCCRFQRGATCQEALPPKTSSPTSHKNGTEHLFFVVVCTSSQSNGIPFILSPLNRTFSYTFITCSRCWALFHPALITCYDTLHTPHCGPSKVKKPITIIATNLCKFVVRRRPSQKITTKNIRKRIIKGSYRLSSFKK